MRYALVLGIFLFMLPTTLFAETRYVSEVREITLRTGPSAEYKIIAMVKSGTPMTVLEESEEWTQVQLSDGKEGWVLKQFLQTKVPDAILLASLQKKHDALTAEAGTLRDENQNLKERVAALGSDLETSRSELGSLSTAHETLKTESSEFLELQAKYKSTAKELAAQTEKANRLEDELSGLINDKRLKWFLLGAGVLIVGMIIGFITKPQRRRSSLL
jgi:SH3 domain protein